MLQLALRASLAVSKRAYHLLIVEHEAGAACALIDSSNVSWSGKPGVRHATERRPEGRSPQHTFCHVILQGDCGREEGLSLERSVR